MIKRKGEEAFIQGCMSAEMIKRCVYKFDVKLHCHGVVSESQCAVGMGPDAYCKHVMLVLFALTRARDGMKTAETCTQQLQTFHQAKKYNGSPVKMQYLKMRRDGSLSHLLSFEPRPVEYRNLPEYPQQFRSVWINSRTMDIPILQLYEPADIRAVHHDHDYPKDTPVECFFRDMNITTMTEELHDQLEFRTRGRAPTRRGVMRGRSVCTHNILERYALLPKKTTLQN